MGFRIVREVALVRLAIGGVAGIFTTGVMNFLAPGMGNAVALVAGWDAAGLTVIALAWSVIASSDQPTTRAHAAREDAGRRVVSAIVLSTSLFSLFAAGVVLRQAKDLTPHTSALITLVSLCLAAVVAAWTLTHTAYTLRYAHLYYRDAGEEGGLTFPGDQAPDAMDFAYFAFTIGMCFQVSDVVITSRPMRRAVLGHALLSFVYNTAILALSLNLVFGLFSLEAGSFTSAAVSRLSRDRSGHRARASSEGHDARSFARHARAAPNTGGEFRRAPRGSPSSPES